MLGAAAVSSALAQGSESGFLKDYSRLQVQKDPLGVERRVWFSPKFTRGNYQKVLIDPVSFYPKPEPTEEVSKGTLDDIRGYADSGLRKALGGVVALADAPGPGVVRLRVAFTAASVDTSLKPYQLLPVGMLFTAAQSAAGASKHDVRLAVESEVTDSVTGEVLGLAVREAKGIELGSGEKLTLDKARPQLDKWLEAGRQVIEMRMTGK